MKGGLWLVTLLLLAALPVGADAQPWQARKFRCRDGSSLSYQWHQPEGEGPRPLLIFLHGAGERGRDNQAQLGHGVRELFGTVDFLVAAPQCPPEYRWVEVDWGLPAHNLPAWPSRPMLRLCEWLDTLCASPEVDSQRIYLMGLSMGAFGAWDLAARCPDRFAAGIFICGGADLETAPKLAAMPAWLFHGARDPIVLVQRSRDMAAALTRAGGQPRYTEYAEVGHEAWYHALGEAELLPWLTAQQRP